MSTHDQVAQQREVALVDLVDRLLTGGVVLGGDITVSIADVDLVYLRLRVLLGSASTLEEQGLTLPRGNDVPPA
ncbi:MAG: gas vesicle protein [Solirubrobacterales bacterium]|nr:gas vesicle protein [Solirubrobacterales bacterium]